MAKDLINTIFMMYYSGYTTGEIARILDINEVDVVKVIKNY